jgi:S1-C subfamily serine protease
MRRDWFIPCLVALAVFVFGASYAASGSFERLESPTVLVTTGTHTHGTAVHLGNGLFLTAEHVTHGESPIVLTGDGGTVFKVLTVDRFPMEDLAFIQADAGPPGVARLACAGAVPGTDIYTEGFPELRIRQRYEGSVSSMPYVPAKLGLMLTGEMEGKYPQLQVIRVGSTVGNSGGGVFIEGSNDLVGLYALLYHWYGSVQLENMIPSSLICETREVLDSRPH